MSKAEILMRPHKRTAEQLKRLQRLPLMQKIALTERRIDQFYRELNGRVCVSFSGGKDSTVLLKIVRSLFPDVKAAFVDTGLEYPEIREFVKTIDNVDWIRPKMSFKQVLDKYGYPVISKKIAMNISRYQNTKSDLQRKLRAVGGINPTSGKVQHRSIPIQYQWLLTAPFKVSDACCDIMKKNPLKAYQKKNNLFPLVGTMASDSRIRREMWLKNGCNAFSLKTPQSTPLAFWTTDDIWEFMRTYNIQYSSIYDMGEKRTGCMFCLFGCQFDDEGGRQRFDRMKLSHPKQYAVCEKLGVIDVLFYVDHKLGRDQKEFEF